MTGQVEGMPVGDPVEPTSIAPSRYLFSAIALLVVAAIGWGAYGHWRRNMRASEAEQELVNFRPSVQVVTVQATAGPVALTLRAPRRLSSVPRFLRAQPATLLKDALILAAGSMRATCSYG
jgi:hypothetical protein